MKSVQTFTRLTRNVNRFQDRADFERVHVVSVGCRRGPAAAARRRGLQRRWGWRQLVREWRWRRFRRPILSIFPRLQPISRRRRWKCLFSLSTGWKFLVLLIVLLQAHSSFFVLLFLDERQQRSRQQRVRFLRRILPRVVVHFQSPRIARTLHLGA